MTTYWLTDVPLPTAAPSSTATKLPSIVTDVSPQDGSVVDTKPGGEVVRNGDSAVATNGGNAVVFHSTTTLTGLPGKLWRCVRLHSLLFPKQRKPSKVWK